jgi:hypothetical protein
LVGEVPQSGEDDVAVPLDGGGVEGPVVAVVVFQNFGGDVGGHHRPPHPGPGVWGGEPVQGYFFGFGEVGPGGAGEVGAVGHFFGEGFGGFAGDVVAGAGFGDAGVGDGAFGFGEAGFFESFAAPVEAADGGVGEVDGVDFAGGIPHFVAFAGGGFDTPSGPRAAVYELFAVGLS